MHAVIMDDTLSDDLRSLSGEAEFFDADDRFLGAFVPAPGGAPGPEWADEDFAPSRVRVAPAAGEKLRGAVVGLKVRDPAGRLLGWFVPAGPAAEKQNLLGAAQ
jgi:hypothetical protein